jgi:AhpD family alkylhydroperoxidase
MGGGSGPRIAPGGRADIGLVNHAIARVLGVAAGGRPPNLFPTLARNRRLFRRWLFFAAGLMPGGRLPRADSELVILRVAHNTGCAYEWSHHERIALHSGLSDDDVQRVREGAAAAGWSPRQALLLRAVDELHATRWIGDELWAGLSDLLSEADLIELCMLVGHYEMLAMTLNSLGVEIDRLPDDDPPGTARLLQRAARRRERDRPCHGEGGGSERCGAGPDRRGRRRPGGRRG